MEKFNTRELESKLNELLNRYDVWRSTIRPERTIKKSYKRIGRILTAELNATQELHPSTEKFKVHLQHPIGSRWLLGHNEWCLYPFAGHFQTKEIYEPLSKLMWAMFHKHPAYAVSEMTLEDERVIADGIVEYILNSGEVITEVNTYIYKGIEHERVSIIIRKEEENDILCNL